MFKYCLLLSLVGLVFSQTNPVTVTVYYESLCPACINFITQTLTPARKSFGRSMVLNMIPYGNAKTTWNSQENQWTVNCQHGSNECYGNELEGCVLQLSHVLFDNKYYFIDCLEGGGDDFGKSGELCAINSNLDWLQVNGCATSDNGLNILVGYGNETSKFFSQGGGQWTPYISYNDVKDDTVANDALSDFIGVTCDHIADPKPSVCGTQRKN